MIAWASDDEVAAILLVVKGGDYWRQLGKIDEGVDDTETGVGVFKDFGQSRR